MCFYFFISKLFHIFAMIIIIVTMRDLFDEGLRNSIFDYKGRQVTTTKFDGLCELFYSDYKSRALERMGNGTKTDHQIKTLKAIAKEKISRKLKPYIRGKYGELIEIEAENDERLIELFVAERLRNPAPIILWHHPTMVKLAKPHIDSRIKRINDYEKTKADLYQAIEDLEHSHKEFLGRSEKTVESVLERGHNFMI